MMRAEHAISRILKWGVWSSGALMLVGFALLLAGGGSSMPADPVAVFSNGEGLTVWSWIADPMPWLLAGLLVLMATPVVRVCAAAAGFAAEGDRRFVVISLLVLAILAVSVVLSLTGAGRPH